MTETEHWQRIYTTKPTDEVGWYAPHLKTSLNWIGDLKLQPDDALIDVGGGASTLVDDLLRLGYKKISVLDLSNQAISVVRNRLGSRDETVNWLMGDITEVDLPQGQFELWHDRAVFHFLTEKAQQKKYRDRLLRALKVGGNLIIGTFELEGPATCSGLPVQRYSAELLSTLFGTEFELKRHQKENHTTPSGFEQRYLYCQFERVA